MSSEAALLRELVAGVAADHPEEARDGEVPATWPVLVELGVPLLGVAEDRGGAGGSVAELLSLVGALGRHAVSGPLLEALVGNWILAHSGSVDERITTVAIAELPVEDGTMSGDVAVVPWARTADRLLVCSSTNTSILELTDPRVRVMPVVNIAGEQRDRVVLERVPADPVADAPSTQEVRTRLGFLWAAALAGAAEGAFELTHRYVRERKQFGQPLVKIHGVSTSLGHMRVQLAQVDAALARASDRLIADPTDATGATAAARIVAAIAATEIARRAHQLHGAIGMTWEYPLHRYTRRLWAWRDAETSESEWAWALGDEAAHGGEAVIWERLTA